MVSPHLFFDLESRIQQRTGWRIRNLLIEVFPERAILRGRASSTMARQLAQNILHDALPEVSVENSIEVDNAVEVLPGMPLS